MMRSLFAGVTGLRSHQTRMDVIGNNIANVNTVGFKKSTVTFKDLYSETISAASAASGEGANTTGGVNPRQIGLGAAVNSIDQVHTAGSAQYTGKGMDVAISGDGYFIVQTPSGNKYTRAGNFTTDLMGNLVSADGYYLQTVPATQEAVEIFSIEGMGDYNLVGASIDAPSGGVIHSGNPTVDPAEIAGKRFSFEFVRDAANPWTASMQMGGYLPLKAADKDRAGNLTGIAIAADNTNTTASTWSADDIEALVVEKLKAQEAAGTPGMAGTGDLQFVKKDDATIALMLGDLELATAAFTADNGAAVTTTQVTQTRLDANGDPIQATDPDTGDPLFEADGVTPVYETETVDVDTITPTATSLSFDGGLQPPLTITNYDTQALTIDDMVEQLNKASARPAVITEEKGEWQMIDENGDVADTVSVAVSMDKAGGYSGEFKIMTTELGQFTLKIKNNVSPVANLQELSALLADSYIEPEVTSEWGVNYTPPTTVQESGLQTLTVDFDLYTALAINQNGAIIAQLTKDQQVTVDGQTINLKAGDKVILGYVPLANFNNPSGLEKVGDNLFEVSANSGEPTFGMPGTGNAGALSPSTLEMSNVDLSEEIVNMIITQRGFQANSRVITTTDTMLEELVNLKR